MTTPRASLPLNQRRKGVLGMLGRARWEVQRGPWGLFLLLAGHQAIVAVALAWDTYGSGYDPTALDVPLRGMWPVLFALSSVVAVWTWATRNREHVALGEALMLLTYGSRAMVVIESGIIGGWSQAHVLAAATWAVMVGAAYRAWNDARAIL